MIVSFFLKNVFILALSLLLPNVNLFNRSFIGLSWAFVFFAFYWATCLFLMLADVFWYNIPLKNCEGAHFSDDFKCKIILQVLFNQIVVSPMYMLSTTYSLPFYRTFWMPNFPVYVSIPLFVLLADATFFLLHWIAHWPMAYKHIHKQHHEIKHRFAAGAIYCHPLEMWFVNLLSGAIPAFLVGFDDCMILVVVAASAIDTTIAHSRWSSLHFVHHKITQLAFGTSLNFFDRIFGCDYKGGDAKITEMKTIWDGGTVEE